MPLTVQVPSRNRDDSGGIVVDDRRCAPRLQRQLLAEVRPVGLKESHRCPIEDISEGGLFVYVPLSYGLNVGQRCEVLFTDSESRSTCSAGEPYYATVVRTEAVTGDAGRQLGAGLRFDQPLFL